MSDETLPLSVQLQLEEACSRFEAAWKAADSVAAAPRIEEHLGATAEPARPALLRELLRLEIAYRRRHGENPTARDYAARFPGEAEAVRALSAELVPANAPVAYPAIANYEVLAELGRGGMAIVYKARQTKLDRLVALKMILGGGYADDQALARFRIEAEAVARLQHPNIVQIHEMGEVDGHPFLCLEYCAGGSLADRLDDFPLAADEAAGLIETLAHAVHAAHQENIIHRDLKPGNILLDTNGTPRIADFGLAKNLDQAGITQTGECLGTPSYMAPEQVGAKSPVGPAVDIYALGAILYELLTGRPPFRGETRLETMAQVVADEPIPPRQHNPQVPRNLELICLKCLEKDPRKRYASAQLLADDLRRFRMGEAVSARPHSLPRRLSRWAQQRPALAVTLAALALFYAHHLLLLALGKEGEGGSYHWTITGLMLAWLVGAIAFQMLAQQPRWQGPALYGWTTLDVLMLTVFLLVREGPQDGLVIGYFLLIGGAALRFRIGLVWYVTALCVGSYLTIQMVFWRQGPEQAPDTKAATMFVLGLATMGLISSLLLRRFRLALAQQQR
jgi:serine/threonine-protein kinase